MPLPGSKRCRRSSPASTTTRTPAMVRLVSARFVATTTLRRPAGGRTQRRILRRGVEIAIQRQDQQRGIARPGRDGIAAAPDFRGARQEHEHVAGIGLQRTQDDASSALLDGFGPAVDAGRRRSRVLRGDVEGASLGSHGTRIAEHRRHRSAVQRRRHDEQAQVVAQMALRIECQREPEIRLQVALVELVEDHAADVLERRIALQSARQDALGHYLDARRSADAGFEPGAVAHELSWLRARQLRQSSRHGARRNPARLQHDDALVCAEPGLVQQRERNHRALARARRRLEHRVAMRPQRRSQCGQRVEDRGGGQRTSASGERPCDYRAGNVHDWPMEGNNVWMWGLALLMVLGGLAGAVLPALPGVPLVFGGLVVAAWADDFQRVGWITLTFLGVLTVASFAIDFAATAMGAKRVGASRLAIVGAALGTLGGLFLGIPGLILGPFVGAVAGEMLSHGEWRKATQAGFATWMGLLFGTLAKLALVFTMLGIFLFAYLIG